MKHFSPMEKQYIISLEKAYNEILLRVRGSSELTRQLIESFLDTFSTCPGKLPCFRRIINTRRLVRLIMSILLSNETYKTLGLKLSLYDKFTRSIILVLLKVVGLCANYKYTRRISDFVFGYLILSFWGWEKNTDFNNKDEVYKKNGVYRPLIITQELLTTSYLTSNVKN